MALTHLRKLLDWSDDESPALAQTSTKHERTVILKHMFTLAELEEDPAAILDIKEDIRDECSKLGDITNVVLYDKELEGVASVKFATIQGAAACVKLMNGRHFSGQKIIAFISTGTERFERTRERRAPGSDDEEEEERRLEDFGKWLEKEK